LSASVAATISIGGPWEIEADMELVYTVILGVVQGLAEFLPISSSGHIVVVGTLLHALTGETLPSLETTNIVLHFGTLVAIFVVFWHRVWRLAGEDRRVIGLLAVGTAPVVVTGLIVKYRFGFVFEEPIFTGCMLIVTGGMLIWASRFQSGKVSYVDMSYRQTFTIGLFQAVAVLPGISRSGSTIAAGLYVGLRRDAAATFSFLLAIPAIGLAIGAGILDLISAGPDSNSLLAFAVGAGVSFGVGLLSLLWLLQWLQKGRLRDFAFWCIPMGILVIVWQLTAR